MRRVDGGDSFNEQLNLLDCEPGPLARSGLIAAPHSRAYGALLHGVRKLTTRGDLFRGESREVFVSVETQW
jgi:hypothetical protein